MEINDFRQSSLFLAGFWQQVRKSPQKVAIRFGQQMLSYQQLADATRLVSEQLHLKSVERGMVVAVALEHSLWHIPVLLGVMNLGAAYVPLDPKQPRERLANIVKRSGAALLVSETPSLMKMVSEYGIGSTRFSDLLSVLQSERGLVGDVGFSESVITLKARANDFSPCESFLDMEDKIQKDYEQSRLSPEESVINLSYGQPTSVPLTSACCSSCNNAVPEQNEVIKPDQTAYIIFTSGSTGQPKGVRISHGALNAFLWAMHSVLGVKEQDTLAAITTVTFDIAALEMYLPLLVGGTVEVFSSSVAKDGNALSKRLSRSSVNVFQATPVTYRLLLESGWPQGWQPRLLLCGGDTLPSNLAQSLLDVCHQTKVNTEHSPVKTATALWNLYGPTETTIWSLAYQVTSADKVWIGHPIPGTQCWVVGENGQEVEAGEVGELYIGGLGLAEGYHDDAQKTAESFIDFVPIHQVLPDQSHPHCKPTPQRVYKTGDSVEKMACGSIRHVGRKDFQVKVRSHLVEPTEIEANMVKIADVKDAIVIAVADANGDRVLRAFYTSQSGQALLKKDIRGYLASQIPEYMMPVTYEWRKTFPVNVNGKIDRKALVADLGSSKGSLKTHDLETYLKSLTQAEKELYETWCGVIGIPNLPQDTNFFDMGGRSLGRLIVTNKAEELFNKKINLSLLYRYPTFNEYIVKVQLPEEEKDSGLILQNKEILDGEPEHFLLFVGGVDVYQGLINALPKNVAAFTLCIEEERHFMDEVEQGEPMSLSALADHYVKTVEADFWSGDYVEKPLNICGVSFGGMLAIEVASQMQSLGWPVKSVCMLDSILMHEVTYNLSLKPIDILEKIIRSPSSSIKNWSNKFIFKNKHKNNRQAEFRSNTMRAEIVGQQRDMLQRRDKALNIAMDREAKKLNHVSKSRVNISGLNANYRPLSFNGDILLIKANDHSEYGRSAIFKDDYGWNSLLKREKPIELASSPGSHLGMIQEKEAKHVAQLIVNWVKRTR